MTNLFNKHTKDITPFTILYLVLFFVIVVSFLFVFTPYLVEIYNLYFFKSNEFVADTSSNKKIIILNNPITLSKDEIGYIVGNTDTLTITGFINSPCSVDTKCIWSGLAVFYDFNVNGVVLHGTSEKNIASIPYRVSIVDSDYTSYAKVIVTRLEN